MEKSKDNAMVKYLSKLEQLKSKQEKLIQFNRLI